MNLTDLTPAQLRQAARLKEKITALETTLGRMLGASVQVSTGITPRRTMSAAARAKIAAAQRARWARQRGGKGTATKAKPRRKISAAGRKRLSQLAKARWAKARAAGKKAL